MGMRISSGGAPPAQAVSQSSVAQWQQRIQQAQPKPAAPEPQVVPKPTATLGNRIDTHA